MALQVSRVRSTSQTSLVREFSGCGVLYVLSLIHFAKQAFAHVLRSGAFASVMSKSHSTKQSYVSVRCYHWYAVSCLCALGVLVVRGHPWYAVSYLCALGSLAVRGTTWCHLWYAVSHLCALGITVVRGTTWCHLWYAVSYLCALTTPVGRGTARCYPWHVVYHPCALEIRVVRSSCVLRVSCDRCQRTFSWSNHVISVNLSLDSVCCLG